MNPSIFISYRREDSAGFARAIHDRLSRDFGPKAVFMDVDSLEPGVRFPESLHAALRTSRVLVAIIGRRWLSATDGATRRIDDPRDYVRLEIAAALEGDLKVIPVLVDGALMPDEDDLPKELVPLSFRNALNVATTSFATDIDRLVRTVARTVPQRVEATETAPAPRWLARAKSSIMTVTAITTLALALWLLFYALPGGRLSADETFLVSAFAALVVLVGRGLHSLYRRRKRMER